MALGTASSKGGESLLYFLNNNGECMSKEVKLYKLVSGEYIVTKISGGDVDYVYGLEPVVLAMKQNPDGNIGADFVPFMPFGTIGEIVYIDRSGIIAVTEPDESLVKAYLEQFHPEKQSGIILPDTKIIT